MREDNIDPLWHLSDVLTLHVAASLIAGYDPNRIAICRNDTNFKQDYSSLFPIEEALHNAVLSGSLKIAERVNGNEIYVQDGKDGTEENCEPFNPVCLSGTKVEVSEIRAWLERQGYKPQFFFPDTVDVPDFLNPNQKNYSPKLAAAISAWQAVNAAPELIKGKTVKKALLKWLRRNADKYGLTKGDGSPNEQGIEEIAKISNWDIRGGAPKTPG